LQVKSPEFKPEYLKTKQNKTTHNHHHHYYHHPPTPTPTHTHTNPSKTELQYDPATPLLGTYPKEIKSACQRDIHTPMFIGALLTVAKIWAQL
jgi:hypothetical protein